VIDKKLEQELWNNVFKTQINYFQAQIRENSSSSTSGGAASQSSSASSSSKTAGSTALSSSTVPSSVQQQKKLESQTNLALFLESARGFYTRLLEDILLKYELAELGRSLNLMNFTNKRRPKASARVKKQDSGNDDEKQLKQLHYICQHILTHLGEIFTVH